MKGLYFNKLPSETASVLDLAKVVVDIPWDVQDEDLSFDAQDVFFRALEQKTGIDRVMFRRLAAVT